MKESLHPLVVPVANDVFRTWITRRSRGFKLTANLRHIIRRFFSLISCSRSSFLFRASCFYGVCSWFIGHFSRRPCENKRQLQLHSFKFFISDKMPKYTRCIVWPFTVSDEQSWFTQGYEPVERAN